MLQCKLLNDLTLFIVITLLSCTNIIIDCVIDLQQNGRDFPLE
uniref:Uncharacterized protein n=1 Tax=Rhizophora mucronata TaxID=61149 RepID=A0A2P2R522_RHIMU